MCGRAGPVMTPPCPRHRSGIGVRCSSSSAHLWFWVFLGFWTATALLGLAVNSIDHSNAFWFVVFAVLVFGACFGFTLIYWPHMQFRQLTDLRKVLLWGLVSGAVAIALAISLEGYLEPDLQVPFAADLWLSGVIEETSKILVPILLWIFGKGIFRDPRVAFSVARQHGPSSAVWRARSTSSRRRERRPVHGVGPGPVAELTHAVWASIAATMIWFAPRRARTDWSRMGGLRRGGALAAGLLNVPWSSRAGSAPPGVTKNTICTGVDSAGRSARRPDRGCRLDLAWALSS